MPNMSNPAKRVRTLSATEAAKNFGSTLTLREFAEFVADRSWPPLDEECLRAIEEGVAYFNRPEIPADPWER